MNKNSALSLTALNMELLKPQKVLYNYKPSLNHILMAIL